MNFTNNFLLKRMSELSPPQVVDFEEVVLPAVEPEPLGTILLAESNPSDLEHIATLLESLHFDVITAMDGETALALVREHKPVVVIASMLLPGIDGYRLAQILRAEKETEGTPFMLIVQKGELPDQLIGHETYAHDYIQKPISVPDFTSRVKSLYNLVRPKETRTDRVDFDFPWVTDNPLQCGLDGPVLEQSRPVTDEVQQGDDVFDSVPQQGSSAELFAKMRDFLSDLERCLDQLQFRFESWGEQAMAQKDDAYRKLAAADSTITEEESGLPSETRAELPEAPVSDLDQYRAEYQRMTKNGPLFPSQKVPPSGFEDIFDRFLGGTIDDEVREDRVPEEAEVVLSEPETPEQAVVDVADVAEVAEVADVAPVVEEEVLAAVPEAPETETPPAATLRISAHDGRVELPNEIAMILEELERFAAEPPTPECEELLPELDEEMEAAPPAAAAEEPAAPPEDVSQAIDEPVPFTEPIQSAAPAGAVEPDQELEPEVEYDLDDVGSEVDQLEPVELVGILDQMKSTEGVPVKSPEDIQFSDDVFFDPELLRQLNVRVDLSESAGLVPYARPSVPEALPEPEEAPLYEVAVSYVMDSIVSAAAGRLPNVEKGLKLSDRMVESMQLSPELLSSALNRLTEFSVSSHCVNVAVITVELARSMGRPDRYLKRVCLAGLLHEVGVIKLPGKLMFKADDVSEKELKLLKNRPLFSADILQGIGAGFGWLPEIVGQVYERLNGKGRPLGLRGTAIFEESQILGIADAFEASVHSRPYRSEPISGYQALFELSSDKAGTFSSQVVKSLIQALTLFPLNEILRLSSGELVRVIGTNPEAHARPVVEVLKDAQGQVAAVTQVIDLSMRADLKIVEVVPVSRQ